jgi:hypothetical protein
MDLKTGQLLRNGKEIMLGDKLKGGSTHEVVVLYDKENGKYIVQIISIPEYKFNLDEFLFEWSDLEVTGSILTV